MRMELLPGVFLTAVTTDKFKTATCSINFLRPLTDWDASCAGLVMRVLMQGTENHPDMQSLALAQEALYGAEIGDIIRKKGEVLSVGLFADFIDDNLVADEVFPRVVNLLREILLQPLTKGGVFAKDYVAREKEGVLNELRAQLNSKRAYAVTQTVRAMCKDEPYGIDKFGSEETVASLTAKELFSYYLRMLETSQIEICYFGRMHLQTVAGLLKNALRDLPREEIQAVGITPNPEVTEVRELTEALDVTQGKLCMGLRITKQADKLPWAAVMLFNAVFGSGVTSKLFLNVREKLSLCYYASSSIERFKRVMLVDSGVDFSNYAAAKTAILQQLEDCKQGNISDEELELARKHLHSRWCAAQDSLSLLDEYSLGQALLGKEETIEWLLMQIDAVTMEQVVEAANCTALDTVYFLKGPDT